MTEQEVLDRLLATNQQLVAMMTLDDNSDIEIDGELYPSLRKYAKSILMGDLQTLANQVRDDKDSVSSLYTQILDLKSQIDDKESSINSLYSQILDLKSQIDTSLDNAQSITEQSQAILNQLNSLKDELDSYKDDINSYKTDIALKLQEIDNIAQKVANSEVRAKRFSLEAQASKLQAGEYANKVPNELVNCWSVNGEDLEHSETCEWSVRHYYELTRAKAKDLIYSCYEFIPLTLRIGDDVGLCIKGSPRDGEEFIDLTLRDGTQSEIDVVGNYLKD